MRVCARPNRLLWPLLALAYLIQPATLRASIQKNCVKWFKKKSYHEAALCFIGVYQQLKARPKRTESERIDMGLSLRNAGLSFRNAARQEKLAVRSAYLRERAVKSFSTYLKNKLYTSERWRRFTQIQHNSIKEKIGYARLMVIARSQSGFKLTGYKFVLQAKGSWSGQVRPGPYTLLTKSSGQLQVIEFKIKPGQPKVLRLAARGPNPQPRKARPAPQTRKTQPPTRLAPGKRSAARTVALAHKTPARTAPASRLPAPPRARKPIWPWFVVGVGAAAAVAGGVLTGLSFATVAERDSQLADALKKPAAERTFEQTTSIQQLHNQANGQLTAGLSVGIAGLALAGLGIVFAALPPRPSSPARRQATP